MDSAAFHRPALIRCLGHTKGAHRMRLALLKSPFVVDLATVLVRMVTAGLSRDVVACSRELETLQQRGSSELCCGLSIPGNLGIELHCTQSSQMQRVLCSQAPAHGQLWLPSLLAKRLTNKRTKTDHLSEMGWHGMNGVDVMYQPASTHQIFDDQKKRE